MMVNELQGSRGYQPLIQQKNEVGSSGIEGSVSFADTVKEFIGDTNELQVESGELTEKMIKGEPVDLHDVMIAANKAKTSFQLLVEMRNKFLDLYKEALRMQT